MTLHGSISLHGKWGDARTLARHANLADQRARAQAMGSPAGWLPSPMFRQDHIHGMTETEVARLRDRFEHFLPKVAASAAPYHRARDFFDGMLPSGANLDPNAGGGLANAMARHASRRSGAGGLPYGGLLSNSLGGGSFQTSQRPYQPEFESPDRQNYPIHRCLLEGELVLHASGRVSRVEDIKVGDELFGPDGEKRRVEAIWSEGRPEQLVEIEWANGRVVRCTREHAWPTTRGNVPAMELVRGDVCLLARRFTAGAGVGSALARLTGYYAAEGNLLRNQSNGEVVGLRFSLHLDEEDLEADIRRCLLTAFDPLALREDDPRQDGPIPRADIAQGLRIGRLQVWSKRYVKGTNQHVDCVCDCGRECTFLIETLAAGNTDSCGCRLGFATDLDEERTSRYLRVGPLRNRDANATGKQIARWCLEHVGEGSDEKALSSEVMAWPVRDKLEFLVGYLRGDGSKRLKLHQTHPTSVGREVSFNTTSEQLGWQISLIALQCGFPGRTHERDGFRCTAGVWHAAKVEWAIGGERAGELARIVWPRSDAALHQAVNQHPGMTMDDDYAYVAVRRVEVIENNKGKRVYDLTVSGDHQYCLAGGLVTHNSLANIYWRVFYKLDPVIGTCIDLFSEMPWSDFTFSGGGVDGEIKEALEVMCETTQLRAMLPYVVREFMVIGEVAPHLFWDDDEGMWTHIALHNPDQLEVIHSPFLPNMEPLVEFKPEDRLRQILTSNNPMLRSYRKSIPEEVLTALVGGQNIPLSPINCTFIPRKLHPYDVRGTSIISRMWRILMYEDAIFNASIAIARRAACFVEGTPVLTTTGLKPIEDMREGDRVISGDGSVQTVEHAWCELPDGHGLVEIKAMGTQPLLCTPTHRFKVWAAPRTCACGCGAPVVHTYEHKDGRSRAARRAFLTGHATRLLHDAQTGRMPAGAQLEWKVWSTEPALRTPVGYDPLQELEAENIRAGDYLVIPRKFDEAETAVRPEAARLLGYFAAEGSKRDVWQGSKDAKHIGCEGVAFHLSLDEYDTWAQDIVACASRLGAEATVHRYVPPPDTKMAESGRIGRTTVYVQKQKDEAFASWLKTHAGVGAENHVLSEEVMRWPLALKREFLIGYFRGDGHFGFADGCPQVTAASVSPSLIYQVRLILAQLGYFGSVYSNPKGKENWHDCWAVSCTARDARALAKIIWGLDISAPTRTASRTWCDNEYVYVPVQEVLHHDDNVRTYNLTVSGDHSYLVQGVQTYNSPLKVAKLGDRTTGWIPDPAQEQRLLELLVQAEVDPAAWLVYHYGIEFDLVGTQERAWKIDQSAEFIERTKLLAMGISKSFLHGEVTYASAASGLTVFLQRLKALREFFESVWLYPKLFRPMAEMNKWVKPTEAELAHNVRTKRSKRELREGNRYIIPTIEWDRPLDPSIDMAMINAVQALSGLGVTFSRTTMASLVNRDYEKELEQRVNEIKMEQDLLAKHPELQQALAPPGGEGGPGGGGGAGISPALSPDAMGMEGPPPDGEMGPPPEGGPPPTAAEGDPTTGHGGSQWDEQGRQGAWGKDEALDLVRVLREGELPEEEPWTRMVEDWATAAKGGDGYARAALRALKAGDPDMAWEAVEEWLLMGGYPPKDVRQLEAILKSEGALGRKAERRKAERLERALLPYEKLLAMTDKLNPERLFTGAPWERRPPRRRRPV